LVKLDMVNRVTVWREIWRQITLEGKIDE
jgi:hypothetical protein